MCRRFIFSFRSVKLTICLAFGNVISIKNPFDDIIFFYRLERKESNSDGQHQRTSVELPEGIYFAIYYILIKTKKGQLEKKCDGTGKKILQKSGQLRKSKNPYL